MFFDLLNKWINVYQCVASASSSLSTNMRSGVSQPASMSYVSILRIQSDAQGRCSLVSTLENPTNERIRNWRRRTPAAEHLRRWHDNVNQL